MATMMRRRTPELPMRFDRPELADDSDDQEQWDETAEIAARWQVSTDVARIHLLPIYQQLSAHNRARASRLARALRSS